MTVQRLAALVAGTVVTVVAWVVLPRQGLPPFSTHMAAHMALVAVAAPLLAIALAAGRFDPVRIAPRACSPIVASMIELVLVWGWHAPALHHAASHQAWARGLEQASFLASGFFLWICAIGGGAALRRRRAPAGIVGLLLTSMHMTLLGALVTLTHRPLFGSHGAAHRWLTPLQDQQLGGAIMLVVGTLAYLAGALWLVADIIGNRRRASG